MLKNLQKRSQGFTIVEVMIVLAIAGLIILVVLLAVPALQRNSRNTSIKNDASAVAGAINEYMSSNNGRAANSIDCTDGVITIDGAAAASVAVTGKVQSSTVCDDAGTDDPGEGTISVAFSSKCNPEGNGAVTGNARTSAVLYSTETTGGTAPQCLEA